MTPETPMTPEPAPTQVSVAAQFIREHEADSNDAATGALAALLAAARLEGRIDGLREFAESLSLIHGNTSTFDLRTIDYVARLAKGDAAQLELQRQPPTAKETK